MTAEWRSAYDAERRLDDKCVRAMCYAPYTSLFFDQHGKARVCCWNDTFPVGDIAVQTIDEIWHGESIRRLRHAVAGYSFENGCGHCRVQVENGWTGLTNMHSFDRYAVEQESPPWPKRIELSISNSCNLECVMCDGEYSSRIRARRERRPPRERIYPQDFAQQLRKYVPHLAVLKFLGGEPLLVPEHYEIWQLMIEDRDETICHVTTNGTQWNDRIAGIAQKLRFAFAVSIDGMTKGTVESIRVGASHDEIMRHLRIFREYTRKKGTRLDLTFCFMRHNWHEFADVCLFAEEWGCNVAVNMVHYPSDFGVYNLEREQIREILAVMERQALALEGRLVRTRHVWLNELDRVRKKYAQLCAGGLRLPTL